MSRITESAIEQLAIEKLEALGYQYVYGPAIVVDGEAPERQSYQQVILPDRVKAAIQRINPTATAVAMEQAFNVIARAGNPDLLSSNETIHNLLTNGVEVSYNNKDEEWGYIVGSFILKKYKTIYSQSSLFKKKRTYQQCRVPPV